MDQDQTKLSTGSHQKGVPQQHKQASVPNPEQNGDFRLNSTQLGKTFVA